MINEILDHLLMNVNEEEKFYLIRNEIIDYCSNETRVFQCYRDLKYLEVELQDLLDKSVPDFKKGEKVILKILKIIKTEVEIVQIRMKFANNLEDIGEESFTNVPRVQWTDPKINLVELIYAVKPSVEYGKVTLKKITECFEYIFQIRLGNIYDMLNEISLRKLNRARYINKLMENFNQVLDKMDS